MFCILFVFTAGNFILAQTKTEKPLTERKVRLSWEEVSGASSYKVLIKDPGGNIIVDKEVDSNHIELEAVPGNYKIRIGAVNKFNKIGSWSDWADISIEKYETRPGKEEQAAKEPQDYRVKLGAGVSYFYILSNWNSYYNNSYNAYLIDIEYSLKRTGFSGLFSFLRYTGFDVEGNYVKFEGKRAINRIESDITAIIGGVNIFISTNFNFPLNFALRGGGGIAYTKQEFIKYDVYGVEADKGSSNTIDPYYKFGLSAEYSFYSRFFLQINADYYIINYLAGDFKSMRFSGLVGIKI